WNRSVSIVASAPYFATQTRIPERTRGCGRQFIHLILLEKSRIASPLITPNRRHAHPDVAEPYRRWSMIPAANNQPAPGTQGDPDSHRLGSMTTERRGEFRTSAVCCSRDDRLPQP